MYEDVNRESFVSKFQVNDEVTDTQNFSFIKPEETPKVEQMSPYTSNFDNEYFLIKYEKLFNFARDKLGVYDELQGD